MPNHEQTCPVCGQLCSDPPLARYGVRQAATHFCPATRNLDRHQRLLACIRRLWSGDECIVLRCQNCGFSFGFPHVGGDEQFYSILHEQKNYPAWKWDYDLGIAEAINKHAAGNVIDVGAGDGDFLMRLPAGWNRYATEGSAFNRDALGQKGIQVFQDISEALAAGFLSSGHDLPGPRAHSRIPTTSNRLLRASRPGRLPYRNGARRRCYDPTGGTHGLRGYAPQPH
jgi:hypothetical protein